MAPVEAEMSKPKKLQRSVMKTPMKSRSSPVSAVEKTRNKKILLKMDTIQETIQRIRTVPKVNTPKAKENKKLPAPPGKVQKPSWMRRPLPANSGVPVPEKMKDLLLKTTQETRKRTSTVPSIHTPTTLSKDKTLSVPPGKVQKPSWMQHSLTAHSGVPVPGKMKLLKTTQETRKRTSTVPNIHTPKSKEKKTLSAPPGKVQKPSWMRRPLPAHSGVPVPGKMKLLKTTQETRKRTSTVPSIHTPTTLSKDKTLSVPPGKVQKPSWMQHSLTAHSGVPVPGKMKLLKTTQETRKRTSTVPNIHTPKSKEKKTLSAPPGKVQKPSWMRRPLPAHSGVPVPGKMKLLKTTQETRKRTSTVPNIHTPTTLSKDKTLSVPPGKVQKPSWMQHSLTAHSGVPVPGKMKLLKTTQETRKRTSTVPNIHTPKAKEKKTLSVPPGKVQKPSWMRHSWTARSGVPVPGKMKLLNTTQETRTRTSTEPKVHPPKAKEDKISVPPGKKQKPSWMRRQLPAHSGVPVPEKMKDLFRKFPPQMTFLEYFFQF